MGNIIQKQVFPGYPVSDAKRKLTAQELVVHDVCAVHGTRSSGLTRDVVLATFHGNLEDVSGTVYMWKRLRAKSLIGFEYPGYGWRGDEDASQRAFLADLSKQIKWIDVINTGKKVIVCGRSLGSFSALTLASILGPDKCDGVILLSPLLTAVAIRVASPLYKAFAAFDYADNETLAKSLHPSVPVFIAHGECDDTVPLWNARALWHALPESCRRAFVVIEDAGHNNLTNSSRLWDEIEKFVDDVIAGSTYP